MSIIHNNEQYVPEWIQEIEIISPLKINIMDFIDNHLSKDKPELLQCIANFVIEVNTHNEKGLIYINQLMPRIENKFKENNIILFQEINPEFFQDEAYSRLLNIHLTSIIKYLEEPSNPTMTRINVDNFLHTYIGNLLTGNVVESRKEEVIILIQEILFDEVILMDLENLYRSISNLNDKSKNISQELSKIIQSIERLQYNTLTKCCPT